jgi:hypothetical protein
MSQGYLCQDRMPLLLSLVDTLKAWATVLLNMLHCPFSVVACHQLVSVETSALYNKSRRQLAQFGLVGLGLGLMQPS